MRELYSYDMSLEFVFLQQIILTLYYRSTRTRFKFKTARNFCVKWWGLKGLLVSRWVTMVFFDRHLSPLGTEYKRMICVIAVIWSYVRTRSRRYRLRNIHVDQWLSQELINNDWLFSNFTFLLCKWNIRQFYITILRDFIFSVLQIHTTHIHECVIREQY